MTSYKIAIFLLIAIFARAVNAEEQCPKSIGIESYELKSCEIHPGWTISKFTSTNSLSADDEFSNMPISVVISKNKHINHNTLSPEKSHSLIVDLPLPHQDQITERNRLNDSAAKKLSISGWKVSGETIAYRAQNIDAGMTIVCAQASKKIKHNYVTVHQCSPFYKTDINNFRKALEYTEGTITAP
ncbi:hypothetical protein [Burkholderia ubonensis]|uniref:hypothetical protein n=1 Tax=Burkholderia ubonensis TaxID=101571 RepID=UPI000F563C79|nr:hypothetical protein [Burkholderia ubonensis]